ncbi:MAG TPA: hypothetical protein VKN76_11955, partial [Kiloniellaceae bacterium]|nr:hypothetical protein [Kiloniellaceae bacterium]
MAPDNSQAANSDKAPSKPSTPGTDRHFEPAKLVSRAAALSAACVLVVLTLFVVSVVGKQFWHLMIEPSLNKASETGQIIIESPDVYTRERLVNDRLRQVRWLEEQLELTEIDPNQALSRRDFNAIVYAEDRYRDRRLDIAGTLQSNHSPSPPPEDSAEETQESAPAAGDEEAAAASQTGPGMEALPALRLTSADEFNALRSYRNNVREELMDVLLDDRHDIDGNTLYRLSFDTAIVSGRDNHDVAVINVKLHHDPKSAGYTYVDMAHSWRDFVQDLVNSSVDDFVESIVRNVAPRKIKAEFFKYLSDTMKRDRLLQWMSVTVAAGAPPTLSQVAKQNAEQDADQVAEDKKQRQVEAFLREYIAHYNILLSRARKVSAVRSVCESFYQARDERVEELRSEMERKKAEEKAAFARSMATGAQAKLSGGAESPKVSQASLGSLPDKDRANPNTAPPSAGQGQLTPETLDALPESLCYNFRLIAKNDAANYETIRRTAEDFENSCRDGEKRPFTMQAEHSVIGTLKEMNITCAPAHNPDLIALYALLRVTAYRDQLRQRSELGEAAELAPLFLGQNSTQDSTSDAMDSESPDPLSLQPALPSAMEDLTRLPVAGPGGVEQACDWYDELSQMAEPTGEAPITTEGIAAQERRRREAAELRTWSGLTALCDLDEAPPAGILRRLSSYYSAWQLKETLRIGRYFTTSVEGCEARNCFIKLDMDKTQWPPLRTPVDADYCSLAKPWNRPEKSQYCQFRDDLNDRRSEVYAYGLSPKAEAEFSSLSDALLESYLAKISAGSQSLWGWLAADLGASGSSQVKRQGIAKDTLVVGYGLGYWDDGSEDGDA